MRLQIRLYAVVVSFICCVFSWVFRCTYHAVLLLLHATIQYYHYHTPLCDARLLLQHPNPFRSCANKSLAPPSGGRAGQACSVRPAATPAPGPLASAQALHQRIFCRGPPTHRYARGRLQSLGNFSSWPPPCARARHSGAGPATSWACAAGSEYCRRAACTQLSYPCIMRGAATFVDHSHPAPPHRQ